jgi:hypothetical protein
LDYSKISLLKTTLANGARYQGESKYGLPSGKGREDHSNGDYYEGEYEKGIKKGKGVLKTKKYLYTGDFKENKFDGVGKLEYENKQVYEGEFRNGFREGKGILKDGTGKILKQGDWLQDIFLN